mmetsp:Transcript_10051/g.17213  ORF Transcript_10051/g.17213 Transcript_10051/m.17213 type:complete len:877 (+) Transcript_10051:70-2700(+)
MEKGFPHSTATSADSRNLDMDPSQIVHLNQSADQSASVPSTTPLSEDVILASRSSRPPSPEITLSTARRATLQTAELASLSELGAQQHRPENVSIMEETAAGAEQGTRIKTTGEPQDASKLKHRDGYITLDAWRTFGLESQRAQMDEAAIFIAEKQDASARARKMLAESTRSLKKLLQTPSACPPETSKLIVSQLKEYQGEIDALTQRSKYAEAAFFSLYRSLYELPDPVQELQKSLKNELRVFELEEEISVLRKDCQRMEQMGNMVMEQQEMAKEFEKRLSQQREELVQNYQNHIERLHNEWAEERAKEIDMWKSRESELQHEIRATHETVQQQAKAYEILENNLSEARSKLESMKMVKMKELNMAEEDLVQARTEISSLRQRVRTMESGMSRTDNLPDTRSVAEEVLRVELSAKDSEIVNLQEQLEALNDALKERNQASAYEFSKLREQLIDKDATIADLHRKILTLPSREEFDTLRNEYEAMQSIQFEVTRSISTGQASQDGSENTGEGEGEEDEDVQEGGGKFSLERRLMERVKLLESRLTGMRNEVVDKDSQLRETAAQVIKLTHLLEDQKSLNARLENSISRMTAGTLSASGSGLPSAGTKPASVKARIFGRDLTGRLSGAGGAGGAGAGDDAWDDWGLEGGDSDTRGPVAGDKFSILAFTKSIDAASSSSPSASSSSSKGQGSSSGTVSAKPIADPSMLDIVTGQRDRFRARTRELEEENRRLVERMDKFLSEMEKLKSDNVALYEKMRYVQNYMGSSGVSVYDEEQGSSSVVQKYKQIYETSGNPYATFSRSERNRRINEMNVADRFSLIAGEKLLNNRLLRLFSFSYMIILHLFVFVVLSRIRHACSIDMVAIHPSSLQPQITMQHR